MAAEAQLPLGAGLQPPRSLTALDGPVWGVDPSTLRMSFGAVIPEYALAVPPHEPARVMTTAPPEIRWATVSLPRKVEPISAWLGLSFEWIRIEIFERAREWGEPALVLVEEPFGGGGKPGQKKARTVHPTSNRMLGVLLAALGSAFGHRVRVELVHPNSWKLAAMGKGRGSAKPPEYLEWAREVAGYSGELEDEAAAIGIATAAGVRLAGRA
jgi:hypothetical protein